MSKKRRLRLLFRFLWMFLYLAPKLKFKYSLSFHNRNEKQILQRVAPMLWKSVTLSSSSTDREGGRHLYSSEFSDTEQDEKGEKNVSHAVWELHRFILYLYVHSWESLEGEWGWTDTRGERRWMNSYLSFFMSSGMVWGHHGNGNTGILLLLNTMDIVNTSASWLRACAGTQKTQMPGQQCGQMAGWGRKQSACLEVNSAQTFQQPQTTETRDHTPPPRCWSLDF